MERRRSLSLFFQNHREWHTWDQCFLDCGPWNTFINWNIQAIFFFTFLVSGNSGCSLKNRLLSQGKWERVDPVQQVFYGHPSRTIDLKFLSTDYPSCSPLNGWHASYKIGVMPPTKSLFNLRVPFLTKILFAFSIDLESPLLLPNRTLEVQARKIHNFQLQSQWQNCWHSCWHW